MSNLSALMVAVEAASRQRDAARHALQTARQVRQAALGQLDQLQAYAQETESRWGARPDTAVQPEVMFHHYQFMGRLDHAAGMQKTVVEDRDLRVQRAERVLLDAELRLASLRKVVEKRRQDLAALQARRDQKQTDERAALQYRHPVNGQGGQEH
ncbi:MAG: flagellar export protein FliJ [Burkholderiaceae bacterium]|nr:flagellar export protein FliJ [Burkholderiaceae bacterium]